MRPVFRNFLLQIKLIISILGIRKLRLRVVKTAARVSRLEGGRPQNALSAFPSGRSRAASAGKLPQGCLQWGWSIPRHFKCTSRRGIWHLNSPCMFFHHLQLVKAHSRPACLRILLCYPRERSRVDPPEPQPGALWLSNLPGSRMPSAWLGAHSCSQVASCREQVAACLGV